MENNKGFTLIEIIATITLMLLITIIAVPTSIKFIERGKNQQYDLLESQIISAASKYYIKHKSEKCISLDKLIKDIDDKFIDGTKIIDPRNNAELIDVVEVTIDGNKVTYDLVSSCS